MDDAARRVLVGLVAEHGNGLASDVPGCRALLRSALPSHPAEVAVLVAAAEEGVAQQLLVTSGPVDVVVERLAATLVRLRGLSDVAAGWAVMSWAVALGVATPPLPHPSAVPCMTCGAPQPPTAVVCSVCGDQVEVLRPSDEEASSDVVEELTPGNITVVEHAAGLRAMVPLTWYVKESVTLLHPDGSANVIVSTEPLDPTLDSETYARVQGDLLVSEFPGYRELSFREAAVFGGRPGYIRLFTWHPPDGVPVRQVQLYHASDGRGMTATATAPDAIFPQVEEALRTILAGLAND